MDSFQQRMRTELMYELRQLAHSNRPVTGQSHRETLQQFIINNCFPEQQQTNKSLQDTTPENGNNVEQHRPEAVIVEVQGVVEQRRVSSVLQSSAFRRQLENVIRGSIESSQRQRATRSLNSQVVRNRNPPASTTTLPTLTDTTRENELPQLQRSSSSDSLSSLDSFSSATSNFEDEDESSPNSSSHLARVPLVQSESRMQHDMRPSPVNSNDAEILETPNQATNDVQPDYFQEERMHRLHQEGLVDEISELLHSRLVSSAMEGEFRATLEVLVENRLSASGTNGPAVQNIVRNLPPSGIIRNDFSHLGIPHVQDNSDNISVTGMSAQSVPYIQTNTYLSREVRDLKAQIMEMKNMMKLTFDLQIDLQRAVRQEVAAAMNQQNAGPSLAPKASSPVDDTHCLICLDRHSDCVLYRCGHLCVCYFCGRDLLSRNLGCPVCRAPIQDVIRAYKTNAE